MSKSSSLTIHILVKSLLSLVTVTLPLCTATCYSPDGKTIAGQDEPCNGGSSESFCCGRGWACLSNKICMRTDRVSGNFYLYGRGSCTDPTWQSAACPSFCLANLEGGEGLEKCEDSSRDSYCCVEDGANCTSNCVQGVGVINFQGEPRVLTTIGVTSTETPVLSIHQSSSGAGSASKTTTESRATLTETSVLSTHDRSNLAGSAFQTTTESRATLTETSVLRTHNSSNLAGSAFQTTTESRATLTETSVLRTHNSSTLAGSASQTATESRVAPSSAVQKTRSPSSSMSEIGVGMGVPLGVIALVFAAYIIVNGRRNSKSSPLALDNGHTYQNQSRNQEDYGKRQSSACQMEPPARQELGGEYDARELPVEANMRHEAGLQ
ncbi:MAG: hypothetical protein HETSPECPRED_002666 [Heterodermia speciosa]|uniref:Uncharacterized protein n=1 Tax=Heterodermia speciosa TaxID=116794 RepID=A0A8H3J574_9LECA|nr:MAG: hypothetical protein HETSPECPRED_002666 [Heterodermia speciosa]